MISIYYLFVIIIIILRIFACCYGDGTVLPRRCPATVQPEKSIIMARVNGIFKITGTLQNVSFYTMKGSDKVYARTKGGPTKRRMKVGPEFELLRKHQEEWKGCVLFSQNFSASLGTPSRKALRSSMLKSLTRSQAASSAAWS